MPTPIIRPSCSMASTRFSASTGRRSATRAAASPTNTSENPRPIARGPVSRSCGKVSVGSPSQSVAVRYGIGVAPTAVMRSWKARPAYQTTS
jgi:hypothetical protein